jgi:predicted amidohydrolase
MDEAARQGADLVVFPEGYPGPTNPANRYDAFGPLAERARSLGLHVVAGRIEPVEGEQRCRLRDRRLGEALIYRRTSPVGPGPRLAGADSALG